MSFITRNIYGEEKQRYQANLQFPYWLLERGILTPVQLDLTAIYNSESNERFGALVSYEGRVTLSRRIGERLNLAFSGSYQLFQRKEDLVRAAGASEDDEQANVETRTASVGPTVIYDARRDENGNLNPLTPYDGYRVTAGAQFASRRLGGTDDFVKASGTAQWYWSPKVLKRVTITNGLRYDQGFPMGDAVLLPEVERFFAGGDTTVRGIEKDHLLVERIQNPLYPGMGGPMSYELVPAGGNIRFLYNLDLQLRITPRWLASAVFFDTGVVMNSFAGFTPSKLRHSVGVAPLRVTTPFATLSIEYAIPLDPQIGDDPRGRFHFNVGFVF